MTDQTDDGHASTTHADWGAGEPHLLVSRAGKDRTVFALAEAQVTIGSDPGGSLVLEGTEPIHATIVHDDQDEYVLTLHGPGGMNASTDPQHADARSEVLRTGARFTIGEWTLVFGRAEYADHGRPFGGREGGEFSHQPAQPDRPAYPAQQTGPDADRGAEVKDG